MVSAQMVLRSERVANGVVSTVVGAAMLSQIAEDPKEAERILALSSYKSGATKPRPNVFSNMCCAQAQYRARSSPISAQLPGGKSADPGTCDREVRKYVFVKASGRLDNRAENSHQTTRERERRMRGFRDPKRTQQFLSCFGPIWQPFALRRHLLCASLHRGVRNNRTLFPRLPPTRKSACRQQPSS